MVSVELQLLYSMYINGSPLDDVDHPRADLPH